MKRYLGTGLLLLAFAAIADEEPLDCSKAISTLEINACAALERDEAQAMLAHYFTAALEHNAHDSELVAAIKLAQADWAQYQQSHCGSVYSMWRQGTIRGAMALSCETQLTRQRTHELWENFLTYADSTPPVLPEPER
ncbi:MAG: DUF1311 domain-containing protein [Pseudomonadaceae bacterium]|nr:MAG: DUF1311 domain-containing protein [Pseudomonadaceae bacterium]